MRQLAWLNAVPEGSKKSRWTVFKEQHGDESSPDFPELEAASYMVALLHEAGLQMPTGMGPVPLTWQEIESWLRTTELDLSVWEKLTLKEMSETYVSELQKSTGKHAVAPYTPVALENIDRTAVASKLLNVLRGFKRKPA